MPARADFVVRDSARDTHLVRATDFWERMTEAFGPHAETLVEMHVLTALGGRTPGQALAAGMPALDVWRAVHEAFELPAMLR